MALTLLDLMNIINKALDTLKFPYISDTQNFQLLELFKSLLMNDEQLLKPLSEFVSIFNNLTEEVPRIEITATVHEMTKPCLLNEMLNVLGDYFDEKIANEEDLQIAFKSVVVTQLNILMLKKLVFEPQTEVEFKDQLIQRYLSQL